jgi:hypothetical protein
LEKTALDGSSLVEDEHPFISRFNLSTYKAFVESPKPPQLVADVHQVGGEAVSIDLIRSRYNAFVQHLEEYFLVYSPLDEICPAMCGELGDYHWVDLGAGKAAQRGPLALVPRFGPGWYGRPTVAFMLDAGFCSWHEIKLTFSAAVRKPMCLVAETLQKLEELWSAVGETDVAQDHFSSRSTKAYDPRIVPKSASVALLGLWASKEPWRYRHITSSCEDDVLVEGALVCDAPGSPEEHGVKIFKGFVTRQKVLELSSMRPLHQRCIETERLQLAMVRTMVLRWIHPRNILSLRVDEVFVRLLQDNHLQELADLRFDQLHTVLPPFRKPKWQRPCKSTDLVFKVKRVKAAQFPGGQLAFATSSADIGGVVRSDATPPWRTVEEPLVGPDNFAEVIVAHVLGGGSCSVEGAAGCGKSEVLKLMERRLQEQGLKTAKICLTNTGIRNLGTGGLTAHSFVMKHILQAFLASREPIWTSRGSDLKPFGRPGNRFQAFWTSRGNDLKPFGFPGSRFGRPGNQFEAFGRPGKRFEVFGCPGGDLRPFGRPGATLRPLDVPGAGRFRSIHSHFSVNKEPI